MTNCSVKDIGILSLDTLFAGAKFKLIIFFLFMHFWLPGSFNANLI